MDGRRPDKWHDKMGGASMLREGLRIGLLAIVATTVSCARAPTEASEERAVAAAREAESDDETELVPGLDRAVLRSNSDGVSEDDRPHQFGLNPTIDTDEENVSSFGLDVDTAAYALARESLRRAEEPDPSEIRVEEFVNYFDYRYDKPRDQDFAIHTEIAPAPHRAGYHVLRIGLQAKDVDIEEREPADLVFVVDVSSSMDKNGRLDLIKNGLRMLTERLLKGDRIAIVAYGYRARVVLDLTQGDRRAEILTAIDRIQPEGATNLDAGLARAYELLAENARESASRRVVLCSDGVANTGQTTANAIVQRVEGAASRGLTLSAVGLGLREYNDALMEQLARVGHGSYAYVDRLEEARRVFTENLVGSLLVVATSPRLQVEFDRTAVARFRLMGYETGTVGEESFDSDRPAPGELGSGHSTTALYEIQLRPGGAETIGSVRLRYRTVEGTPRSQEITLRTANVRSTFAEASESTQLAVVAATFAEKLRANHWVEGFSWTDLEALYNALPQGLRLRPDVAELGDMIEAAASIPSVVTPPEITARTELDRMPVIQ
jgi:Ca-activated chloride channel family protein